MIDDGVKVCTTKRCVLRCDGLFWKYLRKTTMDIDFVSDYLVINTNISIKIKRRQK